MGALETCLSTIMIGIESFSGSRCGAYMHGMPLSLVNRRPRQLCSAVHDRHWVTRKYSAHDLFDVVAGPRNTSVACRFAKVVG